MFPSEFSFFEKPPSYLELECSCQINARNSAWEENYSYYTIFLIFLLKTNRKYLSLNIKSYWNKIWATTICSYNCKAIDFALRPIHVIGVERQKIFLFTIYFFSLWPLKWSVIWLAYNTPNNSPPPHHPD